MTIKGKPSSGTRCFRCNVNEATKWWGDALAFTHGFSQAICDRCAVELQLEHAKERAAFIPEFEKKLKQLGGPYESASG